MKRVKIDYSLGWEDPFRGWAMKWVNSNYWKVSQYFGSRVDAEQECAYLYMLVIRTYEEQKPSRRHLMALYKTTIMRAWMHYAKRSGRLTDIELHDNLEYAEHAALAFSDGALYSALRAASWQLRFALGVIVGAHTDAIQQILNSRDKGEINRQIRALTGMRSRKDMMGELLAILRDED